MVYNKYIGIIGGTGTIGSIIVKYLLQLQTHFHVLIGGRRSIKEISMSTFYNSERLKYNQMNYNNDVELDNFCSQCLLVINAVGPSFKINDKIALHALRNNCHYIDIGGYGILRDLLKPYEKSIEAQKLCFIIGVGWMPGISGVFSKTIIETHLNSPENTNFNIYYGAVDNWSYSSTYDLAASSMGKTRSYVYSHGKEIQVSPFRYTHHKFFPFIGHKKICSPPADAKYDQGYEHHDFINTDHDARRQRGEPQFGRVLFHAGHFVHARLFHRRLYQVWVRGARMSDVGLCLQARVHRVADMDKLLHLLEPVAYLCGFGLVEVVRVRADTVRYVGEEVQNAPVAAAARHTGIGRRIPPAQHERHGQRPEELHHVQRLVLDHHLVRHARRHYDGEQRGQRHTHLQDPPKGPLRTGKGGVRQKLVGLENHIVDLLFQEVDAEIRKYIPVCHTLRPFISLCLPFPLRLPSPCRRPIASCAPRGAIRSTGSWLRGQYFPCAAAGRRSHSAANSSR